MSHQTDRAAAECGKCQRLSPNRPIHPYVVKDHLQAQQALLWAAAVEAFGPEPIKVIADWNGHKNAMPSVARLRDFLRARLKRGPDADCASPLHGGEQA